MNLSDQLRNLLVMASADGNMTEREIRFLTDRAKNWSIPEEEFAAAIRYAISSDAPGFAADDGGRRRLGGCRKGTVRQRLSEDGLLERRIERDHRFRALGRVSWDATVSNLSPC